MWRITQPAMCSGCSSQREESTDVWRSGDFVIVTLQDWCAETGDYNMTIYAKRDHMPYFVKMNCIQYQITQLMLISMEHFALV